MDSRLRGARPVLVRMANESLSATGAGAGTAPDWHPTPVAHRLTRAIVPARSDPRLLTGMSRSSVLKFAAASAARWGTGCARGTGPGILPRPSPRTPWGRDAIYPTRRIYR